MLRVEHDSPLLGLPTSEKDELASQLARMLPKASPGVRLPDGTLAPEAVRLPPNLEAATAVMLSIPAEDRIDVATKAVALGASQNLIDKVYEQAQIDEKGGKVTMDPKKQEGSTILIAGGVVLALGLAVMWATRRRRSLYGLGSRNDEELSPSVRRSLYGLGTILPGELSKGKRRKSLYGLGSRNDEELSPSVRRSLYGIAAVTEEMLQSIHCAGLREGRGGKLLVRKGFSWKEAPRKNVKGVTFSCPAPASGARRLAFRKVPRGLNGLGRTKQSAGSGNTYTRESLYGLGRTKQSAGSGNTYTRQSLYWE